MIKCPRTGRAIATGIGMSRDTFKTSTLTHNSVRCPACGQTHTWDKKDAWVQDPQASGGNLGK